MFEVVIDEEDDSQVSEGDPLSSTEETTYQLTTELRDIKMYKVAPVLTNKLKKLQDDKKLNDISYKKLAKYKKQALEMDLHFTKVIIPSNMRSRYWKYFGFPADDNGDIVSKEQIVCSLCNTPINFHKNTTNLRSHLLRHHKESLSFSDDEDYTPSSPKKISTNKKKNKNIKSYQSAIPFRRVKIEHTSNTPAKLQVRKPAINLPEIETATSSIIESITNDSDIIETNEPITSENVDYQEFEQHQQQSQQQQDYDNTVESNLITRKLSETSLTDLIQQMIIIDLYPTSISEGSGFTNLIWSLCGNVQIPTKKEIEESISKLYIDKSSKLLQTLQNHSQTQSFSLGIEIWHNTERKTLISFYFNYIPRDSPTNFINVYFTTIEVTKYTILSNIFDGINLRNCSAAVVNSHNSIVVGFLAEYGIPLINCFDAVIQRCMKTVFNVPEISSIFTEIHDLFYKHSDILPNSSLLPSIDDLYPWTKYNLIKYFYDNVTFQDEDNDLLLKTKTILECLQPFKLTLETLIDEPNAVCSLIKPLAYKLVEQHFQPRNGDYELAGKIKDMIGKELRQSLLSNKFLIVSSFLDPRFHSFINECEMDCVYKSLNDKASYLPEKISSPNDNIKNNLTIKNDLTTDAPKRSSLKLFFDDSQRINTSKITLEQEIMKYRTEVFTDLEQCPLDWWAKLGYVYPQMRLIADEYKCIPCCTSTNFRLSVNEQIDFNNRRLMLRGSAINQILFLHFNKKYLE